MRRLIAKPADAPVDPGNVPVWAPYPRGERTPYHDPSRRAFLHDLDLTHGPDAIQQAAWEASAFVVRHHIDLSGGPARRIVATGGGTKVPGWIQALADGTGLPVHVAAEPEGAARGRRLPGPPGGRPGNGRERSGPVGHHRRRDRPKAGLGWSGGAALPPIPRALGLTRWE